MSREIDERVVQMKFEKGQFEKDIQTSIHNLDELKKGLDFRDATRGFEDMDRAARGVNLSGFGDAVEAIRVKFTLLDILALDVMHRISNAMIDGANAAKRFVTSLTVDQVSPGWEKYAQKTTSVQTIMAATAAQFSNTAEQMEVVNDQLNKLNWFTDETSYNFVDMVNNIGKFTSNNIALDQSVTAMQGIANWAAISGANANEASRAMYNLAQALATGSVKLIDWKSIENANMATTEFKQTVIDIATEMKTLTKVSDNLWTTLDGKTEVSVANFNEGLSKGWFTNDVLMAALNRYGDAANALNQLYEALGAEVTTSRLVAGVDKYTSALNSARAEIKDLELDTETANKRITESTEGVAQEIADEWGLSLEEARDWLNKFDDETMQFGLKAFKAAQEAKTFTEAIESVKDAVSTGWMKTFELMFGNYTQAKELWTNLANTLYDIFATSGDLRNEMLEQWADSKMGGRDYFIDTIYAGLAAIMSILTPIKAAWQAVFGKMTAEKLLKITTRIHTFVLNLIQTEEQMRKLTRIFRGVFSILDILKTAVTQIVQGAFRNLKRILAALNIDLGETAATFGDLLYIFSQWFKQNSGIDSIFDAIGDAIIWVINSARDLIAVISEFGPVKAIIQAFSSLFTGDFQGIGGILRALGRVIGWLWQQILSFKFPASLDDIFNFFKAFGRTVKESLEGIGMDFSGIEKLIDSFKEKVANALGTTTNAFAGAFGLIGAAIAYVSDLLKDIDWEGIILVAFGVGTLAILWRFADALQGFAGALKNLTGVGASAKGAFDAINGYFTALKNNIKTNNLIKTAIAISALAGAFYLLAQLEWDQVKNGAAAMLAISAAAFSMSKVFDILQKNKTPGGNSGGFTAILLSLAGSLMIFVLAVRMLPEKTDELQDRMAAIVGLMFAVTLMQVALMGVSKFTKNSDAAVKGLINFAGSILILVLAMKLIGEQDLIALYGALPVISALMLVMAACGKLLNTATKQSTVMDGIKVKSKTGGAFGTAIAVVISMLALIRVVKELGAMDFGQAIQGLTLSISMMGVMALAFKAASMAGKYANQAGKMVFFIAAGLAILIPTINKLASMDPNVLVKGGVTAALLTTGIIVPLIAISKFSGQYATKAGMMILEIAGALAIIQLVVKTLGKVDLLQLAKGVAAVGAVILAFGMVINNMNQTIKTDANDLKIMTHMTIIVGILSGLIFLLTLLDPTGALIACVGVSTMLISLGIAFNIMNGIKLPETKNIVAILGMLAVLGVIIGVASAYGDWKTALAMLGGISLVVLAVAGVAQIVKNSATSTALREEASTLSWFAKQLAKIMAGLAVVAVITQRAGGKMTDVLILTSAMSEIIVAIGIMGKLLGKLSLPETRKLDDYITFIGQIAVIVGVMAALIAIMNSGEKPADISQLLPFTIAMSEIMIAMAASLRLMNGVTIPDNLTKQIVTMGLILSAMGVAFGYASTVTKDVNPVTLISFATSMRIVMVAMAASMRVINGVDISKDAIGQMVTMGLVLSVLSMVFGIGSAIAKDTDIPHLLAFTISLSAVMLALAAAIKIMNKVEIKVGIGQLAILALWVGAVGVVLGLLMPFASGADIAQMLGFTVSLSVLLVALGAAIAVMSLAKFNDINQAVLSVGAAIAFVAGMAALLGIIAFITKDMDTSTLDHAIEIMHAVGLGIGELIGGLVEGFVKTAIGNSFVALCDAVGQGVARLADGFQYLTLLPGGALELFADLVALVAAMAAAQFISGLKLLPGIGQIMALGSLTIITDFMTFGAALKMFAFEIKGINVDSVKIAAETVQILAKTESDMFSIGRIFGMLLGFNDFGQFGTRLRQLGKGLADFAYETEDINADSLTAATNAVQILVGLENSLTNKGGFISFITGDDDLSSFGDRCRELGSGLRSFAEKTGDITPETVQGAVNAAKMLVDLESELAPINGMAMFLFGNQSFGQFGTNISIFGDGLSDFAHAVRNLDVQKVQNGVDAGKKLVDLEKEIDETGGLKGMFFGKSDFSTFGSNLQVFGQAMVNFSVKLEDINFARLGKLTDYLKELMSLESISSVTAQINTAVGSFATDVVNALDNRQTILKSKGSDIAKWIASGLSQGTNSYAVLAQNAAIKLANDFVLSFEQAMKIHSPSLVMNEEGHWTVQGLAEGINEDTSAEDAMRQKAQNIVSAFDSEISKLGTRATTLELEKQLWDLTDGKITADMSVAEQQDISNQALEKEIEIDRQKLADLARTVGLRQAELDAIAEVSGVGSEEYEKAYQTLIQARINMETLRQEMEEKYNQTNAASANSWATNAKAIADFQKEYAETYEFLGKTKDDLRRDAYKSVLGYTDEDIDKMDHYNSIMAEGTDEVLQMLGKSREEYDEYAKEISGWSGLYAEQAKTVVDTNKIISDNIATATVDMAASIEKANADAIKKATGGGSAGSAAAAAGGIDIGNTFDESLGNTMANGMPDVAEHTVLAGEEAMGIVGNMMANAGELFANTSVGTFAQGLVDGIPKIQGITGNMASSSIGTFMSSIASNVPGVQKATNIGIVHPVASEMQNGATQAESLGAATTQGFVRGMTSKTMQSSVKSGALLVVDIALNTIKERQNSNSPSKVTMGFGNDFTDGFAVGIRQNLQDVESSSLVAANTAINSMDYAMGAIDTILSSDEYFQPVITPVLDLDQIKAQAAQIPSLITQTSGIKVTGLSAQLNNISAGSKSKSSGSISGSGNQNGTGMSTVEYNFTQNNYSPKALSRTEIYRQTNNQFSKLKEATKG